jgi:NADPH-dependent ferric siderophore reductase
VTEAAASESGGKKAPGRLGKAFRSLFMKSASVVAIDDIADHFRLVTLEGAALQGVTWAPGQKLQIAIGAGFTARTYTPIDWDATDGRTRILGYMHVDGPGRAWLLGLKPGDDCDVFGPRGSLDVSQLAGPLAVFGDETSIGVAYALRRQDQGRAVTSYFEIGDRASIEQLGASLDLGTVTLFERRPDEAHLAQMEAALPTIAAAGGSFVLTGKAGTIQRLGQALKGQGVPTARIATKAYWAPGKTGLD